MYIDTDILDEDILSQLRQEAVKAHFYAIAAEKAYIDALKAFWYQKVSDRIGGRYFSKDNPAECRVLFSGGLEDLRILYVRISFDLEPEVVVNQRIKNGRWGKSKYSYNAQFVVSNIKEVLPLK